MTSQWAWWRLKSPTSRLFPQSFIQTHIKEDIKAPRHQHLCPPSQRASNAENFYLMTTSCTYAMARAIVEYRSDCELKRQPRHRLVLNEYLWEQLLWCLIFTYSTVSRCHRGIQSLSTYRNVYWSSERTHPAWHDFIYYMTLRIDLEFYGNDTWREHIVEVMKCIRPEQNIMHTMASEQQHTQQMFM